VARHGQVGLHLDASGLVGRRAQPFGCRRGSNARRPQDRAGIEALAAMHDAILVDIGDDAVEFDGDAQPPQRSDGVVR
jgi:hypothetical protein